MHHTFLTYLQVYASNALNSKAYSYGLPVASRYAETVKRLINNVMMEILNRVMDVVATVQYNLDLLVH